MWKRYICESLECQARYESEGNKVLFDGGKLKSKQWKWPGCSFYLCHKQSWTDMVGCYFKKDRGQKCFQFHQQPLSAWACLYQITSGRCHFISRVSQVLSTSEQLTETVQGNYMADAMYYSVLSKMKSETFFAPCCTDTLQVVPVSEMTSKEVHCWQLLPGSWSDGTNHLIAKKFGLLTVWTQRREARGLCVWWDVKTWVWWSQKLYQKWI